MFRQKQNMAAISEIATYFLSPASLFFLQEALKWALQKESADTQLSAQFPTAIFFHSFPWYLIIQHLKDLKGSWPRNSVMFPA